jgi:hypothetical protein
MEYLLCRITQTIMGIQREVQGYQGSKMIGRHSVRISAIVKNTRASHDVSVATGKRSRAWTSLAARVAQAPD